MFATLQESVPVVDPSATSGVLSLLWVVVALPALGAAVVLVLGNRRTAAWAPLLGCATVIVSFALSLVCFVALLGRDSAHRQVAQTLWRWMDAGSFKVDMGILYDPLSALFLLLVTGVGALIHIYSVGYMAHDERRARFFGYLNLFVASMLTLVLADNYLVMFLGWEGVGLASYLLIGFWQHKTTAAVAAKKAFVVNRVGDLGMALAIMLAFATFGTVGFSGISAAASHASYATMTALGLLFLLAACGKSAQVPLQSWLLDAMEGPTPVSALIHVSSVGYMEHDVRRARFFAYLNLFVASMLTLVLADNYLVLFLGWEGVGLASYLLIGFWQHKTTAAVAAKKAFVVNRVGDLG
ncbi:MAG TPA: proton-conducting transporter membrane subunit, partial [Nocardioidaceae bacterium]|nr:proton-conducting transporter membrane subunit [Nocardioidaceae bacterium]